MYCGVPSESPVCVMRWPPACCTASAIPKSATSRVAALQQNVLGLDVAMNDAQLVRVAERVGDLARDANRVVHRKLLLALEPRAQRLAGDERHHVVQQSVGVAGVEQRQDVRMLQPRGRPDLAQKALAAERRAEIGVQDLDGDVAIVPEVVGEDTRSPCRRRRARARCDSDRRARKSIA